MIIIIDAKKDITYHPLKIIKIHKTAANIIVSAEIFKSSPEMRNEKRISVTISIQYLYRAIIHEKEKT